MNFGFSSAGDIKPRIKWDAKADKMFRVDRVEKDGRWQNEDVNITNNCAFLLNVNSACVGWVDFTGTPVQEIVVPYVDGQAPPPRPQWENARPTVEFQIKLAEQCGGDIRRFASSAMSVIHSLGELREAAVKAPEYAQGKVPAVALDGSTAQKTKHGTNYVPVWKIVGWHDAPDGFQVAEELARGSAAPTTNGQGIGTPVSSGPADDPADLPSEAGAEPVAAAPVAASGGALTF